MKRSDFTTFTAAAILAAGLALAPAAVAETVPGAPWVEKAHPMARAIDPINTSISNRPAVLLETDNYVYGPGTSFSRPDLDVTINNRGFTNPVTIWLILENRVTNQRQYYSVRTGDFGTTARDMFGLPGDPTLVVTPNLTNFQLFGDGGALGPLPASVTTATGAYQFILEIRGANGSLFNYGNAMFNNVDGVAVHAGNIGSETWNRNQLHFLAAPVNVSGNLTIEAGTVIFGSQSGQGTLVIRQNATINAAGTASLPIIMTSEFPVGERASGDWGGLVVNGSAPTNQTNPQGEGNSGSYGGNNAGDSSGRLSYVRVEFAGIRFSEQNELNGIALQGVGNGTQIDHIQIHHNQDDGIEFFGGTVDAKYVLVTDARDDSLDWTFGWTGRLQHFVALQRTGFGDKGIEADNDENDNDATPRSSPRIANATFVCNTNMPNLGDETECIRFRRGTHVDFTHFVQLQGDRQGFRVTEDASIGAIGTGILVRNGFSFANTEGLASPQELVDHMTAPGQNVSQNGVVFFDAQSEIWPDVIPQSNVNVGPLPATFDGFFDATNYAGGVNPNNPWIYEGWVTWSDN